MTRVNTGDFTVDKQSLLISCFATFKFGGTLFSKILHQAISKCRNFFEAHFFVNKIQANLVTLS